MLHAFLWLRTSMTNMCPLSFGVNLQNNAKGCKTLSTNHMDFLCSQCKETVKLHVFFPVLQVSNRMANKHVNKTAQKRFCGPLPGGILNLNKRSLPPNRILNCKANVTWLVAEPLQICAAVTFSCAETCDKRK